LKAGILRMFFLLGKLVFVWIFLITSNGCMSNYSLRNSNTKYSSDQFGVLTFLPWNDDWNKFMYPKDKAIKAMDLIKESEVKWVRLDFSRTKIQPDSEHKYEFEQFDWLVEELRKRDLLILGVLGYSPPWAAEDGKWNSPPKDIQKFGQYVSETVGRYKGKVDYWEIWNEPNDVDYWPPIVPWSVYADLLKESYQAAKSANSQCVVLHGGLAGARIQRLKELYELGMKDYFDVVNIHLIDDNPASKNYTEDVMKAISEARSVMGQFGDADKEMWWTEVGSSSMWNTRGDFSEERQAKILKEVLPAMLNSGQVKRVFWAFFQDTKKFFNLKGIDYYGLIRSNFSKKPSYRVLKELIRQD